MHSLENYAPLSHLDNLTDRPRSFIFSVIPIFNHSDEGRHPRMVVILVDFVSILISIYPLYNGYGY